MSSVYIKLAGFAGHFVIVASIVLIGCKHDVPTPSANEIEVLDTNELEVTDSVAIDIPARGIYTDSFPGSITIGQYFCSMDSLVLRYDSLVSYAVTEHIIVQANPWIIDSLAATDYYLMKERGVFVQDQKSLVIIQKGDRLLIPDSLFATELKSKLDSIIIDVNVPEYRLRIHQGRELLYSFTVRVGQNAKRFLELAGYVVSLQTDLGKGTIVRIARDPYYINPVNGHRYFSTLRDDGKRTKMPQIPWLETELNGRRTGDMIHPTTNPETLGKAWSNGCIGTKEEDAWRIYYHAPLGTRVIVRYDLEVIQPNGDTLHLPDIYEKRNKIPAPLRELPR